MTDLEVLYKEADEVVWELVQVRDQIDSLNREVRLLTEKASSLRKAIGALNDKPAIDSSSRFRNFWT